MGTEKEEAESSKAATHISRFNKKVTHISEIFSYCGSCLLEMSVLGHHSHLKAGVCSYL